MVSARALTQRAVLWVAMLAGVLLLVACGRDTGPSAAQRAAQARAEAAYHAAQARWRAQRLAALTTPDGWASLIALAPLEAGVHRVGSGADNGIRLPMGPAHLGLFTLRQDGVSFRADAALTLNGSPSKGATLRSDADTGGPDVIGFDDGKGLATVIRRGETFFLRVRHADADSRLHFAGLHYWPGGRGWQVTARFVAHPTGKTLPVGNIIGVVQDIPNPGVLEFTRDGKPYRLEALDEGEGRLFLVFADRTSGHGSYPAGRFLDAPMPDAQGQVLLDFNRSYNPPCAFTPFATCPLPPPNNRLDVRVEAGEKTYRKPAANPAMPRTTS